MSDSKTDLFKLLNEHPIIALILITGIMFYFTIDSVYNQSQARNIIPGLKTSKVVIQDKYEKSGYKSDKSFYVTTINDEAIQVYRSMYEEIEKGDKIDVMKGLYGDILSLDFQKGKRIWFSLAFLILELIGIIYYSFISIKRFSNTDSSSKST